MALAKQLRGALEKETYGEPGGSWRNLNPSDSCFNQSTDLLSDLNVPECWQCKMTSGQTILGGDHCWIECYVKDCIGKIVDTEVLDYWSGGRDIRHKYKYPDDTFTP